MIQRNRFPLVFGICFTIVANVCRAFVRDTAQRRHSLAPNAPKQALACLDALIVEWTAAIRRMEPGSGGFVQPVKSTKVTAASAGDVLLKVAHDLLPVLRLIAASDFARADFIASQEQRLFELLDTGKALRGART